MRYLILLEGAGGELDRVEVARDDGGATFTKAVILLARRCTLNPGDTIKIIDTAPDEG